ncbi:MAG TPA: hypothetical protein VEI48_00480 [Candidatus Sulfotelmatobacter sp.]|nr:hypothetical protein [Candidatus Sulfotelmatobacter sp.]
MLTRRRSRIGAAAALLALAACQGAAPATPPSTPTTGVAASASPQAASDPNLWTRIQPAAIEQPFGFMTVHVDAYGNPVTMCAPCHPAVDTTMTGVASGPGGLVAVGWIFQGFHGEAWHSTDGSTWSLDGQLAEDSVLQAVAADASRYVAVGLDGQGGTAWSSADGVTWQQTASHEAFAASPLRLTAVASWNGGFVIAGYEGTEFGSGRAAFWLSSDGLTWQRAPDSDAFADARPAAVTAGGPGLVAVGTAGPADAPGPAVVWTSADGLHWRRVAASPTFTGARMRTVASVPGIGLVAAGEDLSGDQGVVWTSSTGAVWKRGTVTAYHGSVGIQVRMYAALAGGPGAVVVGTATEGIQYGAAVAWTSKDGLTWTQQPAGVEFADGELTGLTAARSRLYAVGDRGAPDVYVATVWTSPPAWSR